MYDRLIFKIVWTDIYPLLLIWQIVFSLFLMCTTSSLEVDFSSYLSSWQVSRSELR